MSVSFQVFFETSLSSPRKKETLLFVSFVSNWILKLLAAFGLFQSLCTLVGRQLTWRDPVSWVAVPDFFLFSILSSNFEWRRLTFGAPNSTGHFAASFERSLVVP